MNGKYCKDKYQHCRGICLMSIAAKLYNRLILNRIRSPIDAIPRKNQTGFRTGRSCIQQIHIPKTNYEWHFLPKILLFITFVDFKKALDSIDRDMMFAMEFFTRLSRRFEFYTIIRQVRFTFKDSYQNHLLLQHECYKVMY